MLDQSSPDAQVYFNVGDPVDQSALTDGGRAQTAIPIDPELVHHGWVGNLAEKWAPIARFLLLIQRSML